MSGGWDELVEETRRALAEQEAEEVEQSEQLGESVELDEGEAFTGRFRGYGKAFTRNGEREVALVWDADGKRRFFWPKARLTRELDELRPAVGDEVAVVRGADIPSSDPDRNPTQRFAVRVRPCGDPLPGDRKTATAGGSPPDSDIPFWPTA